MLFREDFKNPEARKLVKTWAEQTKQLRAPRSQIDTQRDKFATATDAQKAQLAPQIRLMESNFEKLLSETRQLEKTIREKESTQ